MNARELREQAAYYRRTATLVSDEQISSELTELAARYEDMADAMAAGRSAPPDPARRGTE